MLRLNKHYGQKHILKDINLCFYPGAKIGIVGPNGAGKSTVLKIMAGIDEEFQGQADLTQGFTVGYVPQEPQLDPERDVKGNLELGVAEIKGLLDEFDEVSAKMGEELSDDDMQKAMDRMAVLQDKIDAVDGWNLDHHLDVAAEALVLPPDDAEVANLSGGERRRVALCRALLEKPDLLLLDEPTNHLDAETVEWLEGALQEYEGTVIVITHDRYFLDNITKWILELDSGKGIPFEGNYTRWLDQRLERMAADEKKGSDRHKMLQRELDWIKLSSKDRHGLNQARIREYEQTVAREEAAAKNDAQVIRIAPGPRLGDKVLVCDGLSKGYGNRKLIDDLNFTLPRGAIVGIVGPNGMGKTTLFRMILGEEQPDAGTLELGETVQLAYAAQERDALDNEKSVFDEIAQGKSDVEFGTHSIPARAYVGRFGFKGQDQEKKVGDLSGGERNRLQLAKLVKEGGNLLLLDEPTNDLDVATLRMLEEALLDFSGCALVISHDRFFLNRVCTHLLVFEGDAKVRWFEGNFEDYEAKRKEELGDKALSNRRTRYRNK
jgi:ATP-binding cassette ChvD family protein